MSSCLMYTDCRHTREYLYIHLYIYGWLKPCQSKLYQCRAHEPHPWITFPSKPAALKVFTSIWVFKCWYIVQRSKLLCYALLEGTFLVSHISSSIICMYYINLLLESRYVLLISAWKKEIIQVCIKHWVHFTFRPYYG